MIETNIKWDFSGKWIKSWKDSAEMQPDLLQYNQKNNSVSFSPELGSGAITQLELKKNKLAIIYYDCTSNKPLSLHWESSLKYYGLYFDFSLQPAVTQMQPLINKKDHYFISYGSSFVSPVFNMVPGRRLKGMSIMIEATLFNELLQSTRRDKDEFYAEPFKWENFLGFSSINKDMCRVFTDADLINDQAPDKLYLLGNVYKLMSLFLITQLRSGEAEYETASEDIKKLIILDHIIQHEGIDRLPLLENAAKEVMMSASKFKILFKQHFGLPYYQYYKDIRLQKAKELLIQGNCPVQQIVRMLGYKSASSFSQAFSQKFDMLPRECRRSVAR